MAEGSDPPPPDDPRLAGLARLLQIIDRLRAPDGCPWDRAQTLQSMAPHVLEEAYEVVDALRADEDPLVQGELGDLLMNVFLLARIAEDGARFTVSDVAEVVADKLVRRHPHVFGDEAAGDETQALQRWEAIKRQERAGGESEDPSALAGVPRELPALLRAFRVGEKAAQVGFDWPDAQGPWEKLSEELAELRAEVGRDATDPDRVRAELGDVLFSVVNVARHLGANPEIALRETIDRFSERFRQVERALGDRLADATLDELEAAWQAAK